jgi:threonine-phosphate decarboxylase
VNLLKGHDEQKVTPLEFGAQQRVPDGVHGALDLEELRRYGLDPETVLDFSANVNPYGPSEKVREAIARVRIDRYPDRECLALRRALANSEGVPITHVLAGNGASEIIWLTALAFAEPGERVLVLGPTYCEYARGPLLQRARVITCQCREEADFVPDLQRINEQLATLGPRLAFICNPNNPTGAVLAPATIADWAQEFPGTLFVVDEAYLPFAVGLGSAADFPLQNLLVVRSMTKDCGLAGLRLGYAIGQPDMIAALRQMQPPWSVNAMAQAAGVAALADTAHRRKTLDWVGAAKQELVRGLRRAGLNCLPSATHFFLVRAPHNDGSAFRHQLLQSGIVVRDCTSFELPGFVRIATRQPPDNDRLLKAVAEVLSP